MEDRYLYKAKKKNWIELPKEIQWVVGYITHKPTGEWQILRKCDNPPDGDPMWQKVLIAYEIDPSTICQCTGLKDKNGKLIWENDVVKCQDTIGIVNWNKTHLAYTILKKNKDGNMQYYYMDEELGENIEVIGNIFDNPELLEVKE